jgi:hypothetical protein
MINDRTERLELRGNKSNFTGCQGTVELKLMRGPTWRQSKQSNRVDSQLLLPVADLKTQWKKRGKEELHNIIFKHPVALYTINDTKSVPSANNTQGVPGGMDQTSGGCSLC